MTRQNIFSSAPPESVFGYSRAVRIGNTVHVSGSIAFGPDGKLVGPGDAYAQCVRIFEIIEKALAEAGARMADVVRTRVFCTDLGDVEKISKAHSERFGDIRPASTLVEVTGLVAGALVEIEADAILGG